MALILLLSLPFVAALALWPVRRARQLAAPVSALVYIALAVLAPLATTSPALVVIGRTLALHPDHALYLSYLSVALALLMVGGGFSQESALVWPGSLVTFGLLLASASAASAELAGAFVALAVLGVGFCLIAPHTPVTAMRTVLVLLCGAILMVLAGWAVESAVLDDPAPMAALGQPAAIFGLALLLGVFPFGLWAAPLGRAERPTAAFLGICALGLVVCLRLDDLALFVQPPLVAALVRWGGVATLVYGAVGALLPRQLSAVVAYAAVADLGVAVLALSSDITGGTDLAVQHLAYRGLACATLWVASRVLAGCFGSDDVRLLGGAARRAPLTLAAVLLAGLSLAGLPPMAGFASRTAILATMELTPGWATVWALGAIGPAWGLSRVVIASWGASPPPGSRREPQSVALWLLAASLTLLVLGVFPDLPAWLLGAL